MRDRTFSGKDRITALVFLARFKNFCDTNDVSKGAAVFCVQYFLTVQAATMVHNRLSVSTMSIDAGRVEILTSYKEMVNFLLKTFEAGDAMAAALLEVEGSRQSIAMTGQDFSNEFRKKALSCGTVFSGERMKGYFVENLLLSIRTQLRNYAIDHPRADYESIVRYARGLGSSHRALRRVNTPVSFRDSRNVKQVALQNIDALTAE